jgi:hypothetical protein
MFQYVRTLVIFAAIIISGCSNLDNKRYLVSVYQIDNEELNVKKQAVEYFKITKPLINKNNGSYLTFPLLNEKDLTSLALPAFTQPKIGNLIFVAEFENRTALDNYVKDSVTPMNAIAKMATKEIVFIAKDFNPMGMMEDIPSLRDFKPRDRPAFLMVNDISMNSFLNPMNPYRIMRYMNSNLPGLKEANVGFIRPLEKVENVRGNYAFDVLNLSEWPSEQVFNDFHRNSDFIKLTSKTRNKAFKKFTESKAQTMLISEQ